MKLDAKTIQSMVLIGLDGAAVLFPVLALPVAALEALAKEFDAAEVVPTELPAHVAEQIASIAAGMAAARSSAVTSHMAHHPPTFVSGFTSTAGPATVAGALPVALKTGGGPESVQVFVPPATTPAPSEVAATASTKGSRE